MRARQILLEIISKAVKNKAVAFVRQHVRPTYPNVKMRKETSQWGDYNRRFSVDSWWNLIDTDPYAPLALVPIKSRLILVTSFRISDFYKQLINKLTISPNISFIINKQNFINQMPNSILFEIQFSNELANFAEIKSLVAYRNGYDGMNYTTISKTQLLQLFNKLVAEYDSLSQTFSFENDILKSNNPEQIIANLKHHYENAENFPEQFLEIGSFRNILIKTLSLEKVYNENNWMIFISDDRKYAVSVQPKQPWETRGKLYYNHQDKNKLYQIFFNAGLADIVDVNWVKSPELDKFDLAYYKKALDKGYANISWKTGPKVQEFITDMKRDGIMQNHATIKRISFDSFLKRYS